METLIKNALGQWSLQDEFLEKAATKPPTFQHGSIVHVNKAVTGKGYEIKEEKQNGEVVTHPNVEYHHIDSKCKGHNGLLRIERSEHKDKDLYHQLKVRHVKRTMRDPVLGTKEHVTEELLPHGEPWKKGEAKEP